MFYTHDGFMSWVRISLLRIYLWIPMICLVFVVEIWTEFFFVFDLLSPYGFMYKDRIVLVSFDDRHFRNLDFYTLCLMKGLALHALDCVLGLEPLLCGLDYLPHCVVLDRFHSLFVSGLLMENFDKVLS